MLRIHTTARNAVPAPASPYNSLVLTDFRAGKRPASDPGHVGPRAVLLRRTAKGGGWPKYGRMLVRRGGAGPRTERSDNRHTVRPERWLSRVTESSKECGRARPED